MFHILINIPDGDNDDKLLIYVNRHTCKQPSVDSSHLLHNRGIEFIHWRNTLNADHNVGRISITRASSGSGWPSAGDKQKVRAYT